MKAKPTKAASERDALAVLFAAWQRHGEAVFPVDRRSNDPRALSYAGLKAAQVRGWVWFPDEHRAVITVDGKRALQPYGVRA